jgi:hypothetical protein
VKRVAIAPRRVRAGRRVTVTLVLGANPAGETSIRCQARVRRTTLRLVARRLAASTGGPTVVCTWKVPNGSAGRRFRATVRVTAGAATVRRVVTRLIA